MQWFLSPIVAGLGSRRRWVVPLTGKFLPRPAGSLDTGWMTHAALDIPTLHVLCCRLCRSSRSEDIVLIHVLSFE